MSIAAFRIASATCTCSAHNLPMINSANDASGSIFISSLAAGTRTHRTQLLSSLGAGDRESHGRDLLTAIEAGDFLRLERSSPGG